MNAREVLRPGGRAVGLWLTIPAPLTAELAARTGADYVVVDQQHGAVDAARRELKPEIPEVGRDGIPLRHELVLELAL